MPLDVPSGLQEGLTDFGNIVIAGPVLTVALIWLWRARLNRVAIALGVNALLAVGATILLKLLSEQVGGAFFDQPWRLTTGAPSGHAAVSMVVYGSLGAQYALRGRGLARVAGPLLAVALIVAVDVTRVSLGYHSPADVAAGITVGGIFAALNALIASRSAAPWPPMLALLLLLAATAAAMHLTGLRFDSNAVL